MRVGVLTNYHLDQVGGAEEALDRLSRLWEQAGHEVVMFSAPGRKGKRREWRPTYRHVAIPAPFSTRFGLSRYVRYLRREHAVRPFDIILASDTYWPGHVARLFHERGGAPYVVYSHGGDCMHGSRFLRRSVCRERMSLAIQRAAGCSCISTYVGERLREVGPPHGVTRTIHNGWPDEWSREALPPRLVRGRYIFSMGRVVPLKGFQTLVEAYAEIRPRHPDVGLIIAGEGPYLDELVAQAEALGLQPRRELPGPDEPHAGVCFPGFIQGPVKRAVAHQAMLGVAPSIRQEPNSLVLLELLCGGVPIIASRVGGNPDLIRPDENGDLFAAEDSGDLALRMDHLLSHPDKLAALAAAAAPSVAHLRWSSVAERYLELFTAAIEWDRAQRSPRAVESQETTTLVTSRVPSHPSPRPAVLVVSPNLPSYSTMGNRARLAAVLEHFRARGMRVHLVAAMHERPTTAEQEAAREFADEISVMELAGRTMSGVDRGPLQRMLRPRRNPIARTVDWLVKACRRTSHPAEELADIVARANPDILWCNYAYLAPLLSGVTRGERLWMVDTHDCLHARDESLRRAGLPIETGFSAPEEARLLDRFDVIAAIQRQERDLFAALAPSRRVITVGHAVPIRPQGSSRGSVLFVGGKQPANVRGLAAFLQHAWPTIRRNAPTATLEIVGHVAHAAAIRDLAAEQGESVRLLGHVDDLAAAYDGPSVVVCPVWIGGGLKIKLVEALAFGKSVVASEFAAQGWTNPREGAVLVDHPGEFAAPVIELLNDTARRAEQERAALDYARRHLSASTVYAELDATLEAWLRRHARRAA